MTVLRHVEAKPEERAAYLRMRRAVAGEAAEEPAAADVEEADADGSLAPERYAQMSAAEEIILTVSENGYGKRSSAYGYRVTGRGGKGITAMVVNGRNGPLVASFPVDQADEIMLVTDGGQLIRCPVEGIRVAGRVTQGVIVLNTAEGERVVSVERVGEEGEDEDRSQDQGQDQAPEPEGEAGE
jgi:DNA gyrase subunit A